MRLRSMLISTVAVLAAGSIAYAAGNYSTLPQVASPSFCASQVTFYAGQSCAQTVPAGPTALTGSELVAAGTQLPTAAPPQAVAIPMPLFDAGVYNYVSGQSAPLA